MTAIITTCKSCGREFTPDHRSIVAATWRTCPACRPQPTEEHRCTQCGRPLRTAGRRLCLSCLGVPL